MKYDLYSAKVDQNTHMKTIMYSGNVDNKIIELLGENQEASVAISNMISLLNCVRVC